MTDATNRLVDALADVQRAPLQPADAEKLLFAVNDVVAEWRSALAGLLAASDPILGYVEGVHPDDLDRYEKARAAARALLA